MITINKSHRRSSILVDMLSTNYTPSINVLTKRFRVSRRSIRNDLDEIEKFLQKNLSTTLIFDKSGIIYPDLREVKTQALLEVIDSLNKSDITKGLTKEQRISAILASLILVEKFITIDSISEKLDVSRNTVVNDLKSLKGNLSYYKLELISKPRLGIALEGLEKDRRIAYVKLLRESLSTNQYLNLSLETFTDELDDVHTFPSILYNELFRKLDMRLVVGTCKSIQKSLVARISDIALSNLVIGLAITMHRAKPGQHCDSADYLLEDFVQSPTYQIVKENLDNISNQVAIQVSPEDVCFIVQCVLFSNLLDNSFYPDQLSYVTQRLILGNLITAVSSEVGFDFSLDENLANSLEEEVIPILYRTQHDVSFRYPYIDEIKRSYPNIFIAVQKHTLPLKLFLQLGITEDETALLTMHFIASFINTKRNSVKPRVVVVCGTGLGSSNLLVANLNQVYELDILAVTSLQDLSGVLEVHLPDFIIQQFLSMQLMCLVFVFLHF